MMRRLARAVLFSAWATLALAAAPSGALADPAELTARASASQVEVGEPFTVELRAMSDNGAAPSDPVLKAPPSFTVQGPSVSTQSMIQIFNGHTVSKIGIGSTWQLVASAPGRFVIPAPSVVLNGERLKATPIPIDVVPATGRPRAQPSPFLIPGMPGGPSFPFHFGLPGEPRDDDDEVTTPELAMDTAPDPNVFLRAILDKQTAVVGEQVTISFYVYSQNRALDITERHEAPLTDFVRIPLLKNPGTEPAVRAMAGGRKYSVQLIDRIALFPMHAGALHSGSLGLRFTGRRIGVGVLRESNDAIVNVSEPPLRKRPPGYVMGDVGQYTVTAAVQPRSVDQGGSISVSIKIAGTGSVPENVRIPARTGIEWLDPEKKSSIDAVGNVVSGWRTLGYVVKISESGSVDLGKIELPFWDPAAKRYQTAVAPLGVVEVRPVAASMPPPRSSADPMAGSSGASSADPFAAMPSVRRTLDAYEPAHAPRLGGARFWWLLAAPPFLFVASTFGSRAVRTARSRREGKKVAPSALAEAALREADAAHARGDAMALAAAAERAVHLAIEARTGLKSRGVLIEDLARELVERGVEKEIGERAVALFSAALALRFDPSASAQAMAELGSGARSLVRELGSSKAKG